MPKALISTGLALQALWACKARPLFPPMSFSLVLTQISSQINRKHLFKLYSSSLVGSPQLSGGSLL